jgi:hypothetical protein
MSISRALEHDAVLIGLGLVALLIFAANSRAIVGNVAGGAVDAAVGTAQGIGDAVNSSIINPAVQAATGDPGATLGGKIWEWFHPREADELRYGVNLDGSIRYPSGTILNP